MFINYNFKNFKSFYTETNLSMNASSDKSHEENIINIGKDRISKVKVIYGANASGKTSFIESIDFIKTFAFLSNMLVDGAPIPVYPYAFADTPQNEAISEFSITFIKDEIKYNYSFSCSNEKVINEKLDIYKSSKPTNIFTRTNTNDYKFTTDAKILNDIKTKNTKNKLFLLTAGTWNYEKVKPVIDFILNDLVVVYNIQEPNKYNLTYVIEHNDFEEFKKFCLDFLNDADISINDFEINEIKMKDLKIPDILLKEMFGLKNEDIEDIAILNKINNKDTYKVTAIHNIECNNKRKSYPLELEKESLGTLQLWRLAPILFYTFKEGKTLFIDEIDKSLHPILVEHIIKKFYNEEINKHNAQLICNTHETNLLNLDIFRRDEIMFTEKENKTGISTLYSLAEFSPRKDENIEKAYLLGRFGAIPFIMGE